MAQAQVKQTSGTHKKVVFVFVVMRRESEKLVRKEATYLMSGTEVRVLLGLLASHMGVPGSPSCLSVFDPASC